VEKIRFHPKSVGKVRRESRAWRSRVAHSANVPVLRTDHTSSQNVLPGMRQVAQTRLNVPRHTTTKLRYEPKRSQQTTPSNFHENCYLPLTMEQWVAAVFQVPESLIQVSLQMTVRARCVPLSSAS
jgi:hypothetical protein